MIRKKLVKLWRTVRGEIADPVEAWQAIVETPQYAEQYKKARGLGGFVRVDLGRSERDHRRRQRLHREGIRPRPHRGFLADPGDVDGELCGRIALSVADRRRASELLRLVLRPAPIEPQTWGEQTDVPESADWYNSTFLMLWGSNVPQTRTPDAHFYTEVRYKGAKSVVVCPDYSEASKFADLWMAPKQGTDSALAMAMGHVILKEFHVDRQADYFRDYCRKYSDMPMLVRLVKRGDAYVPERFVRASDFDDALDETNNPEWKTVAIDETAATSSPHWARSASAGATRVNGTCKRGQATAAR